MLGAAGLGAGGGVAVFGAAGGGRRGGGATTDEGFGGAAVSGGLAALLASSSAMIRRMEARISSIEGSCAFAVCVIRSTIPTRSLRLAQRRLAARIAVVYRLYARG